MVTCDTNPLRIKVSGRNIERLEALKSLVDNLLAVEEIDFSYELYLVNILMIGYSMCLDVWFR